jgi:HK97 family phage portal protein
MNFFGLTITRTRKDYSVPSAPHYGGSWRRVMEPYTGAFQHNVSCDMPGDLTAFSAVYACIDHIANDVAKMPIKLVELDANNIWQPVERNSPFWPVLRKPNSFQNRIQFFTCWLISKLLTGNAYILKQRDARNVVTQLYVLDPRKVQARYTEGGRVFYQLSTDKLSGLPDERLNAPASEIIHDLMNPLFHPLCGVSPLYACGMAATQGRRIQSSGAEFWTNQAMPGGILSTDSEIKDELAKEYKSRWEASFGGANRGRVAVLGGGLKYEKLAMSAEESQMIEVLRWTGEDVARAFSVPAYKIGAGPVPTAGNVEALNSQYYSDVLQRHIESIELCLDEGLSLPVGMGTEFDLDVLLRMDQTALVMAEKEAVGSGIKSPNEARSRFNLKPVEGGESPYLQQQNYSLAALAKRDALEDPFGTATPPPTPPAANDDPASEDDDQAEEEQRALAVLAKALTWQAA